MKGIRKGCPLIVPSSIYNMCRGTGLELTKQLNELVYREQKLIQRADDTS